MNNDLDNLIKRILLKTEKQLNLDISEFIDYAINKTYDFEEKNEFFQRFNKILFEDIEKLFAINEIKKGENMFYYVFAKAISKAEKSIDTKKELASFGNEVIDFMFYQVYFNGYIKYTFSSLFTNSNYDTIKKLKKFDIRVVIERFKYYINLFSINKLRISYSYDILGNFNIEKEQELNTLMKLMIEQHK